MEGEPPVAPENPLTLIDILDLLLSVDWDEYLSGGAYSNLANTSPVFHCTLIVRFPWQPVFAALAE